MYENTDLWNHECMKPRVYETVYTSLTDGSTPAGHCLPLSWLYGYFLLASYFSSSSDTEVTPVLTCVCGERETERDHSLCMYQRVGRDEKRKCMEGRRRAEEVEMKDKGKKVRREKGRKDGRKEVRRREGGTKEIYIYIYREREETA